VVIDASHLFASHLTWVGFRRGLLLRKYMTEFISLLAPHADRRTLERAREAKDDEAVAALFQAVELPVR
jgi:LysR family cys regulon transcriptional activator